MFKKAKNKIFYITTSIAYTNAFPHIGYALESIQADVLARYRRFLGEEVFFLTGTDEHGSKIEQAAAKENKNPQKFVDEITAQFKKLKQALNLSNNDFIRTTDKKRHWPVVETVWKKMQDNGDIYKKNYKGLYCVGCEAFVKEKDLVDGKCPSHQKEPQLIEEENYFFKLSKYQDKIKEAIQKNKIQIVPEGKRNEMLSFVEQGLEDISFSRSKNVLKWGIPVPEDNTQTIYVWADALTNYISAIGYGTDKFKKYWPSDIHCIGKDIQKFHCVFWPAMLFSLGLELPKTVFVHGYITSNGQKMSKSLGNVVDPFSLVEKYGTDAVRYFLLREIPSMEDGDFTYEKFETRYNADLAGGLGNLVARVVTLASKIGIKQAKIKKTKNTEMKKEVEKAQENLKKSMDVFKLNEALIAIWGLISFCNKYIDIEKPWVESESARGRKKEVITNLLYAIYNIALILEPFLPETADKIFEQLNSKKSNPIFPRI
jgi:methionyl-tRNA synthetase